MFDKPISLIFITICADLILTFFRSLDNMPGKRGFFLLWVAYGRACFTLYSCIIESIKGWPTDFISFIDIEIEQITQDLSISKIFTVYYMHEETFGVLLENPDDLFLHRLLKIHQQIFLGVIFYKVIIYLILLITCSWPFLYYSGPIMVYAFILYRKVFASRSKVDGINSQISKINRNVLRLNARILLIDNESKGRKKVEKKVEYLKERILTHQSEIRKVVVDAHYLQKFWVLITGLLSVSLYPGYSLYRQGSYIKALKFDFDDRTSISQYDFSIYKYKGLI